MIKSKKDYIDFLEEDRKALGIKYKRPKLIGDEIWRFERQLRKAEYYKNCRIQESTTIGATNGNVNAARIGDNVFIGSGARIIEKIKIADDIAIGANAVVTKDFLEKGIIIAGVPAKKNSDNDSHSNLMIFNN